MLLCGWVGVGVGVVTLEQSTVSDPTIYFDYRYVWTKVGSNLAPIFNFY